MEHPEFTHLGFTRSSHKPDHLLQTPDTFIRAPLPGMRNATAIVHAAPAGRANFTAYTVEFEPDGAFTPLHQNFVYVLEGRLKAGEKTLTPNHFAYVPPHARQTLTASERTRAIVFEKFLIGTLAPAFSGHEDAVAPVALGGDDSGVAVRILFPPDPAYDFAVNTMTWEPGATLPMVEIHVMEHGLLMLEGEGIYRLGDSWYPVKAGDFIWMAPYCPQWFGALGRKPSKYLIYKDWNRHPLDSI